MCSDSLPAPPGDYAHLLPPSWKSIISSWLAEDTPSFDYGGFVVGESEQEAILWGKSEGIIAGVPFVTEIFAQLGCTMTWHLTEGTPVQPTSSTPKIKVATVTGPARALLLGERVALNTIARCSGIAWKSRKVLVKARSLGFKGIIAGTRKTTPGFRLVEKYGMLVGGVDPHRYDLSSMAPNFNHGFMSTYTGSITQAVHSARSVAGFALRIHVECQSLSEAREAISAGADIVMLDNFTPDELNKAARSLREDAERVVGNGKEGGGKRCLVEVSGGLTEENMQESLCPDVDILSTSSIHQGTSIVDFSLKIQPKTTTTTV